MAPAPDLLALGEERFISLTTFRKSGKKVSTAVWVAREGDALIVTTPEGSGKVKRIRNNPRVEVRPCNRFGRVKDGVAPLAGHAEFVTDDDAGQRLGAMFPKKYGLEYRIFMMIEGLMKSGEQNRLIVRISPDS